MRDDEEEESIVDNTEETMEKTALNSDSSDQECLLNGSSSINTDECSPLESVHLVFHSSTSTPSPLPPSSPTYTPKLSRPLVTPSLPTRENNENDNSDSDLKSLLLLISNDLKEIKEELKEMKKSMAETESKVDSIQEKVAQVDVTTLNISNILKKRKAKSDLEKAGKKTPQKKIQESSPESASSEELMSFSSLLKE